MDEVLYFFVMFTLFLKIKTTISNSKPSSMESKRDTSKVPCKNFKAGKCRFGDEQEEDPVAWTHVNKS
jgi:hypothetical protein